MGECIREEKMGRVKGRKGSKKLLKNPVDNEPLPYEILPAGHPPMPPKYAHEEGLRGIDGWPANRLSYGTPSL